MENFSSTFMYSSSFHPLITNMPVCDNGVSYSTDNNLSMSLTCFKTKDNIFPIFTGHFLINKSIVFYWPAALFTIFKHQIAL